MSHLAFQPPGPAVVLDVDYVVVGSGAGGATAAATLARTGARVCLVEAGAWRDPGEYPYSAYAGMRDLMPDFGAAVTAGRASWPIVQGRAVGGSTVINSAIAVRTPGDLFDQWQSQLGFGGDAMRQRVWATQEAIEGELNSDGKIDEDRLEWRNEEDAVLEKSLEDHLDDKCSER